MAAPLTLYEPLYRTGIPTGRRLYTAMATPARKGQRDTLEEEGGEIEVGREVVRIPYLDPRVRSGWFASYVGSWFRVEGVRQNPPHGIAGTLTLSPHVPITVAGE